MTDQLMVATKTFITTRNGHRVTVRKGKTRVRASESLVEDFPGCFKPADVQPVVEDARSTPPPAKRKPKRVEGKD